MKIFEKLRTFQTTNEFTPMCCGHILGVLATHVGDNSRVYKICYVDSQGEIMGGGVENA